MTDRELEKANKIKCEIDEMNNFLFYAERVWTGRIIKQTSKYILKSNPYGTFNEVEFHLDTDLKNKVLDLLREHLSELKEQLNNIVGYK